MNRHIDATHSLQTLFSGLVEQVFMAEIGVCDVQLTGYLSNLLVDFVHADRIHRLRSMDRTAIRDLSRMEAEAVLEPPADTHQRRRLINRYIGDFTLFWTGVYPEHLRPQHQSGADRMREYLLQGKRSYIIASELTLPNDDPPADLLARLSGQFECCVHGLHLVRETWEKLARN